MSWTTFDSSGKQQIAGAVADMPVGTVQPYAGANAPNGWLLCDGSSLSTTAFPELFAAIGYTYGGSGSSFSLPDLRGRVVAGRDNMGGSAQNRLTSGGSGVTGTTLGSTGGAETHTLTIAQMPSHTHTPDAHSHDIYGSTGGGTVPYRKVVTSAGDNYATTLYTVQAAQGGISQASQTVQNTGGGGAHTNTQPTIVLNYIIFATSLDKRIKVNTPPQYVTALPAAPIDGQEIYYAADATNGVIWHLRYRAASSSSYKWEYVGGTNLLAVSNSGTATFTNSWTALTGSVTAPLAGDYSVEFGCMVYGDSATGRDANVQVATSTPSGASDPLRLYVTNTVHDISSRQSKLSAISASATIQLWGKNDSSSATTTTEYRWLAVTPVRVG